MKPFLIPILVFIGSFITIIFDELANNTLAFLSIGLTLLIYGYLTYYLSPINKAISNTIISSILCAIFSYIIFIESFDISTAHVVIGIALLFLGGYLAHIRNKD